jgi:hypothetical protein
MKIKNNWGAIKRIAKVMDKELAKGNYAPDTYTFNIEIYEDNFISARLINLIEYTAIEIKDIEDNEYCDFRYIATSFQDGVKAMQTFSEMLQELELEKTAA